MTAIKTAISIHVAVSVASALPSVCGDDTVRRRRFTRRSRPLSRDLARTCSEGIVPCLTRATGECRAPHAASHRARRE